MNKKRGRLRIIGGQWRSRVVEIPKLAELRPTPDRVRETLFNWLQPEITGIRCLDLCAGSGILSWEALSRGASHATLVDRDRRVVENLRQVAHQLKALEQTELVAADGLSFLQLPVSERVNPGLIFLDPPFKTGQAEALVTALQHWSGTTVGTLIYVETETDLELNWASNWRLLKDKQAGGVRYRLLRITPLVTSS